MVPLYFKLPEHGYVLQYTVSNATGNLTVQEYLIQRYSTRPCLPPLQLTLTRTDTVTVNARLKKIGNDNPKHRQYGPPSRNRFERVGGK